MCVKRIGELLIDQGSVSYEQLNKVLAIKKEESLDKKTFIGELLVELGFVKEEDIFQAFLSQYSIPYIPLSCYQANLEAVKIIPLELAKKHKVVAIDRIGNSLTVATTNPLNLEILEYIQKVSQLDIQTILSSSLEINKMIAHGYSQN
jgi:type IV pilus assembly protein PilB